MKKLAIILAFAMSIPLVNNMHAQETVPKSILLNTLNNVNELKMSNYKTEELYEYNEAYADDIYTILNSDKSEEGKISALKTLRNDAEKDLNDLLGKDFKHYKKLMEKELKPLKKKSKYFKYII